MKITERKLRELTKTIISELLSKKRGLSMAALFGDDVGSSESFYGDEGLGDDLDYGDGDFGESDEKLEEKEEEHK